jgi:pimeloyl-ACP methyl ester carboxylesterase
VVAHQSARLPVSEVGTGPAVVFIHAGVADRRSWYGVMEIVGATHRALAYDRRGYGASTYDAEPHAEVDDLLAVLDGSGLDHVVLVGCSNGGPVAFEAAILFPERVRALVLVDSAPAGAPPADPGPAAEALFEALDQAEADGDVAVINALEARLWLDGPRSPDGRVGGAARSLFLDMNELALRAGPVGDAAPAGAGWWQLPELRVPTLLMVGALDVPHLVERIREMVVLIPSAQLDVVAGAAHLPMLENPHRVAATLLDFLGRTGST